MSLTRKILSNTFWQVLGRVITAVIGVISIKIITNYLPTDVYGQYTTLYEFIGFFAIAADFGLYTIGVREMAKKEKPESEILANILSIRLILVVITLSLAGLVANLIPKYQDSFITSGIWIVAFTTGIALLNGTLSSILQYRLKMHFANVGIIISRLVAISYTAYIVFFLNPDNIEKGFNNLLVAGLVANLVMISLTYYYVRKESFIYFDFNWKYTKELTYKALPYGLALILSTIYFKLDIILLSLIKDYHQVGVYAVPLKFMEILSVIPVFLLNSALPALTETFINNKQKFQETVQKLWTFLTMLGAPILIGGIILAYPITFVISNPQFLSGYHCKNNIQVVYQTSQEATAKCSEIEEKSGFTWTQDSSNSNYVYLYGSDIAFKLILFGMFFSFLNTLFAFSLVAMDKQAKLIIINFIGVLFNLITNLIFIPKYGFIGAAITTSISEIIILVGTYYYANQNIKISIPIFKTLKIITAAIIMGLVVYILQGPTFKLFESFNTLILIFIGAFIYAILLYKFKVISNDEIKKLLG